MPSSSNATPKGKRAPAKPAGSSGTGSNVIVKKPNAKQHPQRETTSTRAPNVPSSVQSTSIEDVRSNASQQHHQSRSPPPLSPSWGDAGELSVESSLNQMEINAGASGTTAFVAKGAVGRIPSLASSHGPPSSTRTSVRRFSSVGSKMKEAREQKGLSLEVVAAVLQVPSGATFATSQNNDGHHQQGIVATDDDIGASGVGSLASIEDGSTALESWSRIFFALAVNLKVPVDALLPAVTCNGYPLPPASRLVAAAASEAVAAQSEEGDTSTHPLSRTATGYCLTASLAVSSGSGPISKRAPLLPSCGARLRELRQRAGLTGIEATEGTRLTTSELLALEAGSLKSPYERWGSVLGRFCTLVGVSAFSLVSAAAVGAMLDGEDEEEDGSLGGSDADEEVTHYVVDDLDTVGNSAHSQPFPIQGVTPSSPPPRVGNLYNRNPSGIIDEDDAFGLNPTYVFETDD